MIRVTRPPFDKYTLFHPVNLRSIFSITMSQTDKAREAAPNDNPKYVIRREATLHPSVLAKCRVILTFPTSTSYDLSKFNFSPDTASKHSRSTFSALICSCSALQKISVSFANNKCEIEIKPLLESPTEKPAIKPFLTTTEIILLKASIIITKRNGDRGSLCLSPREPLKKLFGLPLIKIENLAVEMHHLIHEHNFSPKPHLFNK